MPCHNVMSVDFKALKSCLCFVGYLYFHEVITLLRVISIFSLSPTIHSSLTGFLLFHQNEQLQITEINKVNQTWSIVVLFICCFNDA